MGIIGVILSTEEVVRHHVKKYSAKKIQSIQDK